MGLVQIRSDVAWLVRTVEPGWLRRARTGAYRWLMRAAEAEHTRLTRTYVTGVVTTSGAGSNRLDCPEGHTTLTSSAVLATGHCYCGRSMIEGRGPR